MGETVLRTARLLLRPARASDLDDLFAIMSDPETMRFWSTDPHPDPGTTVPVLERMIAAGERGHDFVIELDGRAVGRVGAGRISRGG